MSFSTIRKFLPPSISRFASDTLGFGNNLFSANSKETKANAKHLPLKILPVMIAYS